MDHYRHKFCFHLLLDLSFMHRQVKTQQNITADVLMSQVLLTINECCFMSLIAGHGYYWRYSGVFE